MENVVSTVAFGTAVIGYDLLSNKPEARVGQARKITSIGLTGGTAAGDCAVEIWVDNTKIGTYYNTRAGDACSVNDDMKPAATYVKSGALIQAKVIDAAPANNMHLEIEFSSASSGYTGRRTYGRRRSARTTTRRTTSMRRF